jgi:multimeric flavodoxin WrbA
VLDADILVLCGPIWLGDNSSVMKRVSERLYACSSLLNDAGQYAYYGRVAGCLVSAMRTAVFPGDPRTSRAKLSSVTALLPAAR